MVPLIFHVTTFEDGMTATLDVPQQNSKGVPASAVSLDGSRFTFEMNVNPAKFVGTVDDSKSTIRGTWAQGELEQPLVLTRQTASP